MRTCMKTTVGAGDFDFLSEEMAWADGCGKLDRARSQLYRNEILQENRRLKALAEIYTMHSFALI